MKKRQNNLRLSPEIKDDYLGVEQLLDLVFTPRRKLLSSYKLRGLTNKVDKLSYVIKDKSKNVVGSIRFWSVKINNHSSDGLLLGPLAVHPIYQSEGLGEKLVSKTLNLASAGPWNWVVLVGDVGYYSKFGFSKNPVRGISLGAGLDDERLLGMDLSEKFLSQSTGYLIIGS